MKTCNMCGAQSSDNAKFCTECGAILSDAAVEIMNDIAEETVNEVPAEEINTTAEPAFVAAEQAAEAAVPVPIYGGPEAGTQREAAPEPEATAPEAETSADEPKNGEHTVKGRAFGIIGFIISLESLLYCLIPFSNLAALIGSIVALIFCRVSRNNTRFRLANVARVFGILALVFSIVTIVLYGLLMYLGFKAIMSDPQIQDFINNIYYNLYY